MKNILLVIIFLLSTISVSFPQSNIKTWTETTAHDFTDNELYDLIITNNADGEVQLPPPLVKTVEDYVDNSIHRFVAKDSAGNFVKTWVQGGNVFVKKYSFDGVEISKTIQVNEINGIAGQDGSSRVDIFDDGTYMVVWADLGYNQVDTAEQMFGQIYKDDSIKVGSNFKINEFRNYSANHPVVLANEYDGYFWIFYTMKVGPDYKIHIQKRDKLANKFGESFYLNKTRITQFERDPRVISDENYFYVVWDANTTMVSTTSDIFFRRFFIDGTPADSIIKVNDDNIPNSQSRSDLCVDKNGNLFIVWVDTRDSKPTQMNGSYVIYGQLFDNTGNRRGSNLRLDNDLFQFNAEPDLDFSSDEFRLSYLGWDEADRRYLCYVNGWKVDPKYYGEMISSVFLASPSGCNFEEVNWNASITDKNSIKIKLRSGNSLEQLNNSSWYGPVDSTDYYSSNSSLINPIHNGDNYVQYKAIFNSQDGSTPLLNSLSISFSPADSIPPSSPINFQALSAHSSITLKWNANKESDIKNYFIYRRTKGSSFNSSFKVVIPHNINIFNDFYAKPGIEYYYVITAMDSSYNESEYSNEVSAVPYGINIYVSAAGNSNGDGSITNPFNTIQQGINIALFGDTIRVLPGKYSASFTLKNGISLVGTNTEECKIDYPITAADSSIIKGLTISKTITCNSGSPIITENIINGTSAFYMPAIYLDFSSSPIITKNFITECNTGISFFETDTIVIKNNIINAREAGLTIGWNAKAIVENNTIIGKKFYSLRLESQEVNNIKNNIFVTLDQWSTVYNYDNSPSEILYNTFWNSYQPGKQVPVTNLFLDPKFVNMDLQDYNLLPTSPCINAGDPDPKYNDIDGSRNDMGAYGGPDPFKEVLSSQLTKSIAASSLSGYPGDTVSVYISLDNTTGLAKADFILGFDNSIVGFLNAGLTEATKSFNIQQEIKSETEIKFILSSNSSALSVSKEILKINFIVDKNSEPDEASPFVLKNVFLFDANLKEINIRSITDGAIVVNENKDSQHYIYVDSKNTGTENGSRSQPYNTIMEAINKASEGDTILVLGGNYYERVIMKEGIYLKGSGASVTFITLTGDSGSVIFSNISKGEISGFSIIGDESHYATPLLVCESSSPVIKKNKFENILMGGDASITFWSNSTAVFENNYVKNTYIDIYNANPTINNNVVEGASMGAIFSNSGSSPLLTNNIMEGRFATSTVYINNSNPLLRNNLIYCNDGGFGIMMMNVTEASIYNNIIKDKSNTGTGIKIHNSSGNEIINNTIITNGKGIEENSSTSTLFNNIIMNNSDFGVQLSPASVYNYNDVWKNSINYLNIEQGINDISLDPIFMDTSKNDYRLSSNSPCINTGNPDSKYNDADGSRNDIGAYGGPHGNSIFLNQNNSSMEIDSVASALTDTVEVIINGKNLTGFAEIEINLSFDQSLLKMLNANTGNLSKGFSLGKKNPAPGTVNLNLKSNIGLHGNEGDLIHLYFAVDSKQSISTSLMFDSVKVKDETSYEKNIFDLKNGKVNISLTGVPDNSNSVPLSFALSQNYPNPFNPSTVISYQLPVNSNVELKIYDLLGREVITLVNEEKQAGAYEIEWNAKNFASGIYFYVLNAGGKSFSKKMCLIK